MKLTEKQEKFCLAFVETSNKSEAYRMAYDCSKMKPESVWRKAVEVFDNVNVAARIKQLQDEAAARNRVTVDDLLRELEEARIIAMAAETPQSSAAVAATMGKAKLLGMDKQLVELSGTVTTRCTLDDFYDDGDA